MTSSASLLIVGASARAAAGSARRAGFQVSAADLFGDWDLQACQQTWLVSDYPAGFATAIAEFGGPWMYTGGLENHPAWIDRFAQLAPLWGNPAERLRAVRHPLRLAQALRDAGFRFPETYLCPLSDPPDADELLPQANLPALNATQATPARKPSMADPSVSDTPKLNLAPVSHQLGSNHARIRDKADVHDRASQTESVATVSLNSFVAWPPDPMRVGPERWLRKPLASAGGQGIQSLWVMPSTVASWRATAAGQPIVAAEESRGGRLKPGSPTHVVQKFVPGSSRTACFIASGAQTRCLGVTRQLVGCPWAGAHDFQYVGSIGPLPLRTVAWKSWERLGHVVAEAFGLCGLFGVDAIVDREGILPIEVNPRYPASLEVLEPGLRSPALRWHVAACSGDELNLERESIRRAPSLCVGKAILYAKHDFSMPTALVDSVWPAAPQELWPTIADIPRPGTVVSKGQPIWTLFASGSDLPTVARKLRAAASGWYAIFKTLHVD